ncbi:MAG: N-acetylglucosamine-specific PTS transporter subunit IIBC [Pseudomonadota bacterium]|jgi:PTS system N-acetylglucosamine-specific IIC component|nr:N-acetylglucosamine-specific PTS transporter subunit IIBC [Pseudomonadota bacterium]
MKQILTSLQKLGGALMLPIAVLPAAALLLRLGQPDLLNIPVMAAAGQAIFANLGLLFAVGVAIGLARDNHGAAGLAAAVSYLVINKGAAVFVVAPTAVLAGVPAHAHALVIEAFTRKQLAELTVPVGIVSGLMGGALYNRFHNFTLPSYLAFFGGRRFVPIITGFVALPLAILLGMQLEHIQHGMDALSRTVLASGPWGLFVYGVLNRLLIVTGLHNILNSFAWFIVGHYHGVTGDMNRFFAGDPHAGAFMAGFFPVMMFGLPAACLAMYHTARPERRPAVAGLLLSIALTSFLTGVTEPVEFTFMFLAPGLYLVHALLTGLAFVITNALDVRLGFGFSAGLFDYILNFKYATHPLLLLPIGAVYVVLYYCIFRYSIVKFDLKTPGRENEAQPAAAAPAAAGGERARAYIAALGGPGNLESVNACTTRLRLTVHAQSAVNEAALKALGAVGMVRPTPTALQVIIGPVAEQIAGEMREALQNMPSEAGPVVAPVASSAPISAIGIPAAPALEPAQIQSLLAALGGAANVRDVATASSRLRIALADAGRVNAEALQRLELRGSAWVAPDCLHVIVGPAAPATGASLRAMLGATPSRA